MAFGGKGERGRLNRGFFCSPGATAALLGSPNCGFVELNMPMCGREDLGDVGNADPLRINRFADAAIASFEVGAVCCGSKGLWMCRHDVLPMAKSESAPMCSLPWCFCLLRGDYCRNLCLLCCMS